MRNLGSEISGGGIGYGAKPTFLRVWFWKNGLTLCFCTGDVQIVKSEISSFQNTKNYRKWFRNEDFTKESVSDLDEEKRHRFLIPRCPLLFASSTDAII